MRDIWVLRFPGGAVADDLTAIVDRNGHRLPPAEGAEINQLAPSPDKRVQYWWRERTNRTSKGWRSGRGRLGDRLDDDLPLAVRRDDQLLAAEPHQLGDLPGTPTKR